MAAFAPPPLSAIEPDNGGGFTPPPPIPDDSSAFRNFAAAAGEMGGQPPQSLSDAIIRAFRQTPPGAAMSNLEDIQRLGTGDLSQIPFVGRVPEIMQAEKTPAFSKERFSTAMKTLQDLGLLAGAEGIMKGRPAPEELPPIQPEIRANAPYMTPPPVPPGLAGAEVPPQFQFQGPDAQYQPPSGWQPPPPVPDVAQSTAQAPPATPQAPPPMSVADQIRNAQDWQRGLQNEALHLQQQADISQAIGQQVHPTITDRIQQINQELARGYQPPPPTGEIPNASSEPSTAGASSGKVRPGVAAPAPLRQSGQTAPVRQSPAGNGQRGAGSVSQEIPNWWERGVASPPTAGPPVAAAPPPVPAGEPVTTGVANRIFGELAQAGQMEPVPAGVGKAARQLIRNGERDLALGRRDPNKIMAKVLRGNAVTPKEFAVLRAELKNLHRQSIFEERQYRTAPSPMQLQRFNAAFKRFNDFAQNVVQPAKTQASDLFRAMQEDVSIQIGSGDFTDLRKAFIDEHGRDLKPREVTSFQKASDKIAQANAERQAAIAGIDAELAKAAPNAKKLAGQDQLRMHVADTMKKFFPC